MTDASRDAILLRGARQNNLKNLSLDIPLNELVVVTGVSGSGKSSLVFDTLYAEGQRRYVETFSPYARQFLDRMDKPQIDSITGIPPAIAIDQTNPVRTSRSTVGTMTELNDHLKLLFARGAALFCRCCGKPVRRDSSETIYADIIRRAKDAGDPRLLLCFPVPVPANFKEAEVRQLLEKQGYTRFLEPPASAPGAEDRARAAASTEPAKKRGRKKSKDTTAAPTVILEVVQDRFRASGAERGRVIESLEAALRVGQGRVSVHVVDDSDPPHTLETWKYSSGLHCADCDLIYKEPNPSLFSFNSPVGACESCRGFGRTIGIDYGLVIPDESKSLRGGAVKTWQTKSYAECQDDLIKYAKKRAVPIDTPWRELSSDQRKWVIEGEGPWSKGVWYGAKRFFEWLETRSYKMHVRVLLSRYRAYTPCNACDGARLKTDALLWRLGSRELADSVLAPELRFRPHGVQWSDETLRTLPGLTIHDLMLLPIDRAFELFRNLELPKPLDEATDLLLTEIRGRFGYLSDVGLGYLTLDRQSRTLSGGEVQRINLTTALGTSLVNTLFVLDEPSIGLHPRDMQRVITVMKRLRDAGNSLVVVEHDPQIMLEADRILDMGPGAGERGGEIVFFGSPQEIRQSAHSLTGEYLSGRKTVVAAPNRIVASTAAKSKKPAGNVVEVVAEAVSNRWLELRGASEHNLKNIDVRIPLKRLACVTGVSGSGKSTLVEDVLYPALLKYRGKPTEAPGEFSGLRGAELIDDVVMVDQTPVGRTTRSNPASYVGAFDVIRALFATEPAAQERKYTPGTFSFNSGNGRCPTCSGNGFEHVEMQFLSDVYLRCPDCNGRRYRDEVLDIKREGANGRRGSIADVLDMTVTEAIAFFADSREVAARLAPLADVGLEYVKLGQPVPTLSGGEAQRLKLAGHLAEAGSVVSSITHHGKLFLFDEPTTGLHFDDVAKLLKAFRKLLAAGHSLLVIEHNLDVIRASDWIVDLGPEGGDRGGEIVCTGTPAEVAADPRSHTGRALASYAKALTGDKPAAEALNQQAAYATFGADMASEGRLGGYGGAIGGVQPRAKSGARESFGGVQEPSAVYGRALARTNNAVVIHNAREHNLKSIDVQIPRDKFTVITGVSGSGKSTLAFDILFNEGQRRYLESLNAYARQFVQPAARPDVDAIFGIPPTVAIEQRTSRGGRKSTVATLTEIYHFLRLLYVKLGTQYCPDCDVAIEPQSTASIAARLLRDYKGKRIALLAPLVIARKGYYTDLAKWASKKGFKTLRVDGAALSTSKWPRLSRFKEHTIELPVAEIDVASKTDTALHQALQRALDFGKGIVHVLGPKSERVAVFSTKRACPSCGRSFAELDPRLFSFNSRHGWCESCFGTGVEMTGFDEEQSGEEIWWNEWYEHEPTACSACEGQRLSPIALNVRFRDRSIASLTRAPVAESGQFFAGLSLTPRERAIARDLMAELRARLGFLDRVGLGYLQLDRAAPTLSGGEAQRIRLAAQLGSNLQGVCYVLDEPTIGLHPRDNAILLDSLTELAGHRNTLVVVEHDEETIRRADYVLDLGPAAGVRGGEVVGAGTVADLIRNPKSTTGRFLRNPLQHPAQPHRAVNGGTPLLKLDKVALHNIQGADFGIPLGRLVVITGVSGSGKSTVARDVLYTNLRRLLGEANGAGRRSGNGRGNGSGRGKRGAGRAGKSDLIGCAAMRGVEHVDRVLEVDQTPIGKTPRSCPATYIGFWDDVRNIYAGTTEARIRGYTTSRFSFNTAGGRCEACEGQGVRTIEMSFLPDVKVACDVCGGRRFNSETLSVLWRGKSIGDILAMDVDDAVVFFQTHPRVHHALKLLQDVGLGYLTLGQQSPTLSGGEAQRIKLVTELAKVRGDVRAGPRFKPKHTLYVLDEPTVGLHMADVEKLVHVLHRLVEAGNTAVVVEHNLDIMAEADWIVDMGPEAGDAGGRIVAQGTPADIARKKKQSHTGRVLNDFLRDRATL